MNKCLNRYCENTNYQLNKIRKTFQTPKENPNWDKTGNKPRMSTQNLRGKSHQQSTRYKRESRCWKQGEEVNMLNLLKAQA